MVLHGGRLPYARWRTDSWDQRSACWRALDLRPVLAGESTSRNRGCVIAASEGLRPRGKPRILTKAPAPERTLIMRMAAEGYSLTVGSFHQVASSDRRKWGHVKKRQMFEAIPTWAARHKRYTIFGIDANSPKVDHPAIDLNVYYADAIQREHLLHDPDRTPHNLRDVFRHYLDDHPKELHTIASMFPVSKTAWSVPGISGSEAAA